MWTGCAARTFDADPVIVFTADPFDTYVYQQPLGEAQVLLIRDVPDDEPVCFVLDDGDESCSTWGELRALSMGFRNVVNDTRLAFFSQYEAALAEIAAERRVLQAAHQALLDAQRQEN